MKPFFPGSARRRGLLPLPDITPLKYRFVGRPDAADPDQTHHLAGVGIVKKGDVFTVPAGIGAVLQRHAGDLYELLPDTDTKAKPAVSSDNRSAAPQSPSELPPTPSPLSEPKLGAARKAGSGR
jgi:hypothetical protein